MWHPCWMLRPCWPGWALCTSSVGLLVTIHCLERFSWLVQNKKGYLFLNTSHCKGRAVLEVCVFVRCFPHPFFSWGTHEYQRNFCLFFPWKQTVLLSPFQAQHCISTWHIFPASLSSIFLCHLGKFSERGVSVVVLI